MQVRFPPGTPGARIDNPIAPHSLMPSSSANSRLPYVGLSLLFVVALVWRGLAPAHPSLANSVPLAAMCFGGAFFCGRHWWWVPAFLLLSTDAALTLFAGNPPSLFTLCSALFFLGAAWLGSRRPASLGPLQAWLLMLGGSLATCVIFYGLANTSAWALMPEYPKSLAGWWQSQTIGLPGPYPPALAFLRNALVGNTVWCLLAGGVLLWRHRTAEASNAAMAAA